MSFVLFQTCKKNTLTLITLGLIVLSSVFYIEEGIFLLLLNLIVLSGVFYTNEAINIESLEKSAFLLGPACPSFPF
jgi:uncharacterized protein (DUF486 family)